MAVQQQEWIFNRETRVPCPPPPMAALVLWPLSGKTPGDLSQQWWEQGLGQA